VWLVSGLLMAASAQAQGNGCEQFKDTLAARIEASGGRGFSLEIVPGDSPVPADAKVIGNCGGGVSKILLRRGSGPTVPAGGASATALARSAEPARPLPTASGAKAAQPAAASAPRPASALPGKPGPASAPATAAKGAASAPAAPGRAGQKPVAVAPAVLDAAGAVDRAVARLAQSPFTLLVPAEMSVGQTVQIQLTTHADAPSTAQPAATGNAAVSGDGPVAVAEWMQAQLSGQHFRISPPASLQQAPDAALRAGWTWQVEPLLEGTHGLSVSLSARLQGEGEPAERVLRIFDKAIVVKAAPPGWLAGFISLHGHWLWLLLPVLAALAFWVWRANRYAYDASGLPRGPKL
jgi:hypothetical protein